MHFVGIWNPKGKTPCQYAFTALGKLSLAVDNQVEKCENDRTTLFYQGTIFDRSPNEIMQSQSALDGAFGLYSYVKISKSEEEVIIGTDRLGFSPLYYSQRDDSLYFSTSLTLLKYLLRNVTPNYEAWEELLNLYTILGNKTTVKEISRLAAGTRIHINGQRVSFQRYWSPEIPEKCEKNDYIRKNNELLYEALEHTRKINLQKVVLLSGGEDSRRIALAVRNLGLAAELMTQETFGKDGVEENTLIAQEVAESLKMPFKRVKPQDKEIFFNDFLTKDFWLAYETGYHVWMLPLLREIPASSLIYDGILGDVTITGTWARKFPNRYLDKDVDKIATSITEESHAFGFNVSKLESTLFERVREQLREIPDSSSRMDYFYILNRARRSISLGTQLQSLMGHKTCCPYLYYPLFMQSMSLDPLDKIDVFYQRECMRAIDHKIAEIPSTRGNVAEKYHIDRRTQKKEIDYYFYRRLKITPDLWNLLPQQALQIGVIKFSSMIGLKAVLKRGGWYVQPLTRLSNFVEWVGDVDCPGLPVEPDRPTFLVRRYASELAP